jgi:signal transduction histidine kinase
MTALAKRNMVSEDISYYLDMIDTSSNQLLALINDILDMSKIDAGKLEIISESFDFEEMLGSVIRMSRIKTCEKNQRLIVDMDMGFTREMIGDSLRLSQVMINLLNNATKFTPEVGTITVSVSEKRKQKPGRPDNIQHWLRVSVADNGIGISEEKQKRLLKFKTGNQVFERAYA